MSLAKYMKLYKDYGFFNSSIVRVRIPDTSFYGSELILSKDGEILRTRTIDDDVVDISTDESGTLTLSADNGASTLSGTVTIGAYGTYNITLSGGQDKERLAYASKNVTLDNQTTSDTVDIGYTGDLSSVSAVSSNTSVCTVSVNGNKVTVRDAGKDFSGQSTITATVSATRDYDASEVTFNVNKLTGTYVSWEDGSDAKVAQMIAMADAGDINLADFWKVGDTRRVHINAIEAGTATAAQPEQDIDLVIMHDTTGNSYYPLTTPLESGKAYPNFVIGTKDCLSRLSAMAFFSKTISAIYSSYSYSNTSYYTVDASNNAEIIDVLNDDFISALPQYLQDSLKTVNRRYVCAGGSQSSDVGEDVISFTTQGVKSHKISLLNLRELGFTSNVVSSYTSHGGMNYISGIGVYRKSGSTDYLPLPSVCDYINPQINNCGAVLSYYADAEHRIKKQGASGNASEYFLPDAFMWVSRQDLTSSSFNTNLSMAFYIDANGQLQTNNLDTEAERVKLRGVAPIMFI